MSRFVVQVKARDGTELAVPPAVQFSVQRFGWHAVGRARTATITATGDPLAVAKLLFMLRAPIDIYDERGRWVWGGYIAKVAARNGVAEETRSLDEMTNAVQVAYTTPRIGSSGGGGRATTAWATNDESVQEYGRKETLLSFSNMSAVQAEARRDQTLAERGEPLQGFKLPFGAPVQVSAELTCKGWFETLRWRYYADSTGYEGHEGMSNPVPLKIGQAALTSTGIRFADGAITIGIESHWTDTPGVMKLGQTAVSGTDIGFEDLDEDRIYKLGGGLDAFIKGEIVTISGASLPDNNGEKDVIDVLGSTHLVTSIDVDSEGVGNNITLTPRSYGGIGQKFTTVAGIVRSIKLLMQQCIAPADTVTVSVYADVAGVPAGGALYSQTLSAAAIPADMDKVAFAFSSGPLVSAGQYWFVVTRSGSPSSNAYALGMDYGATYGRGECRVNNGGWVVPSTGACDLLFEVETEPTTSFQGFVAGDIVTVNGSTSNSSTYTLSQATATALTVEHEFITEEAGATVTLTPYGGGYARQTYQLGDSATWLAGAVRLYFSKTGAPADSVEVTLRDDVGTLLATATLPAAEIGNGAAWLEWNLDALVPQALATTYHLRIARTGAFDSQNAYVVWADQGTTYTRGEARVWNGSTFVARSPAADLNFIVVGFRSVTEQIVKMVNTVGGLLKGADDDAPSTVFSNPQRGGETTALDEVEGLLLDGAGGRILADVDEGRRVRLYSENSANAIAIRANGTLETLTGERLAKHLAPVGVWAELRDILPSGATTRVFIEAWEYDATRDRLTPTIRGERDPWAVGGIRQG